MEAKVNINLKEGTIDLEGSEAFVSKYLDIFKEKILSPTREPQIEEPKQKSKKVKKRVEPEKAEKTKTPHSAPKVEIENFNIDGDKANHIPTLEDFIKAIDSEKMKSSSEFILAVSFYVTKVVKIEDFSDGNIEYAYKALNQPDRPVHLRQTITNIKNKNNWFEPSGVDNKRWKLTRIGEIYFEKNLKG